MSVHLLDTADVPSPIDLRLRQDAQAWADVAMAKRPWRVAFFEAFAREIEALNLPQARVLELGSGPGFLAEHLLDRLPTAHYTALDFSVAMHELAQQRLERFTAVDASRIRFVERSFKAPGWADGLGTYDVVVTLQAVHELRHKKHAVGLHEQVQRVLRPHGQYLVCDHWAGDGGMSNRQLYMSIYEQQASLLAAGFTQVKALLAQGGLVLHRALCGKPQSGV
jgi:ubiquinone/menaquinone biosynthesis C-methylase UbiE